MVICEHFYCYLSIFMVICRFLHGYQRVLSWLQVFLRLCSVSVVMDTGVFKIMHSLFMVTCIYRVAYKCKITYLYNNLYGYICFRAYL